MRTPRTTPPHLPLRACLCALSALAALLLCACSPDDLSPAADPAAPPNSALTTATFAVQRVCGGPDTVPGIDVSHWQGTINWDTVAASGEVGWAYLRMGDGLGTDREFDRNWREARRVGIPRGAYHFFRPSRDALQQAQHFMTLVNNAGGHLPGDLPPMIDVEDDGGQSRQVIGDKMQVWMDYVEAQTGMRPVIYTGSYFWDAYGPGDRFQSYHLWTPHYTTNPCPYIPNGWDTWTIWQYTDSGSVSGISGNVDLNHFNGPLDDLLAWPSCSTVKPISECGPPAWWCPPLDALHDLGILSRTCADFNNGDHFSRAEWAKLVSQSLNLPTTEAYPLCRLPFSDVAPDDWFARDVATLAALDHADGVAVFSTERTTFEPTRPPTRCEAAKLIAEAWNLPPAPALTLLYPDAADIPPWCAPHVQRLAALSLINHTAQDPFRPNDLATAGEAAAMLHNAITQVGRPTPSPADFYEPSCRPPLTCQDQCAAGAVRCAGPDLEACAPSPNGCTDWQQPQRCPDRQACTPNPDDPQSPPTCADTCDNICTPDDLQCDGTEGTQRCVLDDQGCPTWADPSPCPPNALCVGAGQCTDRCALPSSDCDTSGNTSGTPNPDPDPADTSSLNIDIPSDIIGMFPGSPSDCTCATRAASPTHPRALAALLAAFALSAFALRRRRA